MKKLLVVVVLAGLGYVGYTKWTEMKQNSATAAGSLLTHKIAPEGIYYLLQTVTITADSGAISILPGTKVSLISTGAGGMRVSDGKNLFEVNATQVTNDATIASHLPGFGKGATVSVSQNSIPSGVYYLTQTISVTTESGIIGMQPGTKVTLVSANPTGMRVTDGKNQFDVNTSQVTNDLSVARNLPGFVSSMPAAATVSPNGVYYLLQRISVTTDSGVIGIAPGTKVTMISTTPDGMHVTDGTNQFDVNASQVTSDLAVAENALKADGAAQAQLEQYRAQQAAALHDHIVQEQQAAAAAATPTPVASAPAGGTSLDQGAYNSTKKWYTDQYGRKYWVDVYGVRHYGN